MEYSIGEDARVTLEITPDVARNVSTVRVTHLYVRNLNGGNYGDCWLIGEIRVNGTVAASLWLSSVAGCRITYSPDWSGGGENYWGGYTCQELELAHATNGTAQAELAVSVRIYTTSQKYVGSIGRKATVQLPGIPRVTDIHVSEAELGQELTVRLSRASEDFRDTVTWRCGSLSGTLAEKTDAAELRWTPPVSLAAQATEAAKVPVNIICVTWFGDTRVGSVGLVFHCPIPESVAPTAALTVSDRMGYAPKHGGYLQNQSQALVQVTAAGAYGSEIRSVSVRCGGLIGAGESVCFALAQSGAVTVQATVTDSRGRTAEVTQEITVLPYSPPQPRVERAFRCTSSGVTRPDGAYICIRYCAELTPVENGTASYVLLCRIRGGGEFLRRELTHHAGTFSISGSLIFPAGLDDAYDCFLEATDSFTTVESPAANVGVAFVLLDFLRSAKAIGIGMRAQRQNALSIGVHTDMTAHRLRNLAPPQAASDAATKEYVDAALRELKAALGMQ